MCAKRISPLDDDLGMFSYEILLAEDEQGPGVGVAQSRKTDIGGPFGCHPQWAILLVWTAVVWASILGQAGHPKQNTHT